MQQIIELAENPPQEHAEPSPYLHRTSPASSQGLFRDREGMAHFALQPSKPTSKSRQLAVFKLVEAAQKTWRRLDGNNQLPKLILGVKFADGLELVAKPANRQPATVAA